MVSLVTDVTTAEKANSVADAINSAGCQAIAVPGDMLNDEYIDELVKKAAEFGDGKIHIIVNNAGFVRILLDITYMRHELIIPNNFRHGMV